MHDEQDNRVLPYVVPRRRERRPLKASDVVGALAIVLLLFVLPVLAVLVSTSGILSFFHLIAAAVVLLVVSGIVLIVGLLWTRSISPIDPVPSPTPVESLASASPDVAQVVLPYATPIPDSPPPKWPTVVDRLLVGGIGGILFVVGGLGVLWWLLAPQTRYSLSPVSVVLPAGLMIGGVFPLWLGLRRR